MKKGQVKLIEGTEEPPAKDIAPTVNDSHLNNIVDDEMEAPADLTRKSLVADLADVREIPEVGQLFENRG